MEDFGLWFMTGLEHICSLLGYDHILYIAVLSILFNLGAWKRLLVLITAFTIGHSLSLALSVFNIVRITPSIIEVLIPLTILITCVVNILRRNQPQLNIRYYYYSVLLFGFIHGMGFSGLLVTMLGSQENITEPLLAFNIGLEAGQLIIVCFVLLISLISHSLLKLRHQHLVLFISGFTFLVATWLMLNRITALIR